MVITVKHSTEVFLTSKPLDVISMGLCNIGALHMDTDTDQRFESMWSSVRFDTACSKQSCQIRINAQACSYRGKRSAEICIGSGSRAQCGAPHNDPLFQRCHENIRCYDRHGTAYIRTKYTKKRQWYAFLFTDNYDVLFDTTMMWFFGLNG